MQPPVGAEQYGQKTGHCLAEGGVPGGGVMRTCLASARLGVPCLLSRRQPMRDAHALLGASAAYPPDLQDAAVQTVLQQAEVLAEKWAA